MMNNSNKHSNNNKFNKLKMLGVLLLTPMVLMACGKKEQREVIPMPQVEEGEPIDTEQFRVDGDRLIDPPVLGTEERRLRFIDQYERVDRPVIMNTLRYLQKYDADHEGAFEGVRLITDKSIDELKDKKIAEYTEHLGEPLNENITKIYDIDIVFPYTGEDIQSYYSTVMNILQNEVTVRTQTHEGIRSNIESRNFNQLKNSGIVRVYQGIIDLDGGLEEQVMPYIQEMDKLVAEIRVNVGLDKPRYTTLEDEVEEVEDYVMPKPMTVQEIIKIEPNMELYQDVDEQDDSDEESDSDDKEKHDSEIDEKDSYSDE